MKASGPEPRHMWRRERPEVVCIGCGERLPRDDAREYDKHGDRWDRRGKEFEHLCKPCHRDLCHQPRAGLESFLEDLDAGEVSQREFLRVYGEAVSDPEAGTDERGTGRGS